MSSALPPPQPSPLFHAPGPCARTAGGPSQRPSVRAPRRAPAGRGGGGPRHFSDSIRAGLGAGREAGRAARATESCWRQRLGGRAARIGVRDQRLRPVAEGRTLRSLWALGASRVRQALTPSFRPLFLTPVSDRTFLAQRRRLGLAPPLCEPPFQGSEPDDLPSAGAWLYLTEREHPPRVQLPASSGRPGREASWGASLSCPGLERSAACLSSSPLPSPRLGKLRLGEGRKLAKGHRAGARERSDRGSPPSLVPPP